MSSCLPCQDLLRQGSVGLMAAMLSPMSPLMLLLGPFFLFLLHHQPQLAQPQMLATTPTCRPESTGSSTS